MLMIYLLNKIIMNEIRIEHLMLHKFVSSIMDKITYLNTLTSITAEDKAVVETQVYNYKAIIGEIEMFIENCASEQVWNSEDEDY